MFFGQLEGTGFEVLDPRFASCVIGHARVERLWTGTRWSEFAAGRYILWSDIPNYRLLRYDECSGHVAMFRQPSNNANGNAVDRLGRLITCEHLSRRVTRTEHDGSITVLNDAYQGKRLNSPNDVVVKSDGSIWFTDPNYGILFDYEGQRAESEIGRCNVYRIDSLTGETTIVAGDGGDQLAPWHFLYFFPDPQGHGSLRPMFLNAALAETGAIGLRARRQ